ncbi:MULTISPECIES: alpha/beta fold hydrolase [Prochlorococcus]|uniref:Alpha/beta superfamily hydrolase n=1 Tax=Prochlorococcus marinus (strain SARG / CCMP1375 / SS120) TaxID=167539 RepID=Q7VB48_PROMA|nr:MULTISPECIES: alpha/beta fold hydrolase [Prochlorococcus]AAQ00295.1 Alpha/beta superfamily hydrolase [Prochlorococcus marinus subsp. marinus str. CCMP1375]KGG14106.1 putative alpha/beta hydrolase [Prochlorococcus marinus str. LG]KGG20726.1 putative alpha/beta hydrolase [Prochlorococcus marinus str. SS2]KGG25127.1 putative alpha/beta hydrolase [Prochlorococcus marinus str. SS35]KGG33321.1 putative alpha/beta hydrolase [Prochlorococcus marinus str. SS51]
MNPNVSSNNNPNWGKEYLWKWKNFSCHWRVLGKQNKKPLILLHGFGASSAHWRNNAQPLAQNGFKVYGLDLIGFGKSEQPGPEKIKKLDNRFWSRQVAAFLHEVVNTENNGKAILIGNSLGGLVAVTTAAFYPELVEAVIAAPLPDPALMNQQSKSLNPRWVLKVKNFLVQAFFKLFPLELLITLIIKTRLINIALQAAYVRSIKKDSDLKRIVIEPTQRKSAAVALRAMCIGMATREELITAPFLLNRINSNTNYPPVLLAWGRQDKFIPLLVGKRLVYKYPWLELIIIENTGHCPHDESPSDFNQYVLDWLRNNSGDHIQQT